MQQPTKPTQSKPAGATPTPASNPAHSTAPSPAGTGTSSKPPTGTPVLRDPVFHRNYAPNIADLSPTVFTSNFRVLSIDGGGARGMIPAVILKEIERRSGKQISQLFDRICGTSTGAILACGLAAPQSAGSTTPMFHAREIVEIYRTLGATIFSRGSFDSTVLDPMEELLGRSVSWLALHAGEAIDTAKDVWNRVTHPLHDVYKLAYTLHGYLGDLKMKDALTELFVYAYDIGSRTPEILGSVESSIPGARPYTNFRMYQAATASSAAVPFFAPYTVWANPNPPMIVPMPPPGTAIYPPVTGTGNNYQLVDGGNGGLGNPTLLATLEETPASAGLTKIVLSLGTGHFSQPVSPAANNWGFVQWIGDGGELLNSVFDGVADATDMVMRQILEKNTTYFRWQPSIPESLEFLDEGSAEDMGALEDVAQAFIAEHDEEIDALVDILNKPRLVRAA